jgi:hypothetical protein
MQILILKMNLCLYKKGFKKGRKEEEENMYYKDYKDYKVYGKYEKDIIIIKSILLKYFIKINVNIKRNPIKSVNIGLLFLKK